MVKDHNFKIPSTLFLVAILAGSWCIVTSLIYIALTTTVLIYRTDCYRPDFSNVSPLDLAYSLYLQDDSCTENIDVYNTTQPWTVYIMILVILSISCIQAVSAILLIASVTAESMYQYCEVLSYLNIVLYLGSLGVDLTLGSFFAQDYSTFNDLIQVDPNNFLLIITRTGIFMVMTLAFKGFITHVVSTLFIGLLLIYLVDYIKLKKEGEHSILKMGALNAFDNRPTYASMNRGFLRGDESRPTTSDNYNNSYARPYERVDSWQMQNPKKLDRVESWRQSSQVESRPFSYLEESQRSAKSPSAPTGAQWQGDWPRPPIPAPDYTPPQGRRMKSALKSTF